MTIEDVISMIQQDISAEESELQSSLDESRRKRLYAVLGKHAPNLLMGGLLKTIQEASKGQQDVVTHFLRLLSDTPLEDFVFDFIREVYGLDLRGVDIAELVRSLQSDDAEEVEETPKKGKKTSKKKAAKATTKKTSKKKVAKATTEGKKGRAKSYTDAQRQEVQEAIEAADGISKDEICKASGLDRGIVDKIVLALREEGVIQREGSGMATRWKSA